MLPSQNTRARESRAVPVHHSLPCTAAVTTSSCARRETSGYSLWHGVTTSQDRPPMVRQGRAGRRECTLHATAAARIRFTAQRRAAGLRYGATPGRPYGGEGKGAVGRYAQTGRPTFYQLCGWIGSAKRRNIGKFRPLLVRVRVRVDTRVRVDMFSFRMVADLPTPLDFAYSFDRHQRTWRVCLCCIKKCYGRLHVPNPKSNFCSDFHGRQRFEAVPTYIGRLHEVLFGEDGFIGTQAHLPPELSFSPDFGHFVWKMMENSKFSNKGRYLCT